MSSEKDDMLVEELLRSIQSTTSLIQNLMSDIKGNEKTIVALEIKLENLSESAKVLTKIVRDDNGTKSIITRLAIVENDLNDLYESYKEFKSHAYKKFETIQEPSTRQIERLEQKITKIEEEQDRKDHDNNQKFIAVLKIAPGVIAFIMMLAKLFFGVDIELGH